MILYNIKMKSYVYKASSVHVFGNFKTILIIPLLVYRL